MRSELRQAFSLSNDDGARSGRSTKERYLTFRQSYTGVKVVSARSNLMGYLDFVKPNMHSYGNLSRPKSAIACGIPSVTSAVGLG